MTLDGKWVGLSEDELRRLKEACDDAFKYGIGAWCMDPIPIPSPEGK